MVFLSFFHASLSANKRNTIGKYINYAIWGMERAEYGSVDNSVFCINISKIRINRHLYNFVVPQFFQKIVYGKNFHLAKRQMFCRLEHIRICNSRQMANSNYKLPDIPSGIANSAQQRRLNILTIFLFII